MSDLESELRRLARAVPQSKRFIKQAKSRLMCRIKHYDNETWFKAFLRTLGRVLPSARFRAQARLRLLERISFQPVPLLGWISWAKRVAVSTLVMILAVTSTLFFVEGGQVVSASENTYLEVLSGEVTIRHENQLVWNPVPEQADLVAGDLIRLGERAEAIVHFFDDTELRLGEKTSLLIDQLAVSPVYARQGVIEVALNEGRAWVQALGVDDGFARFTLKTRDAVLEVIDGTLDVHSVWQQPTEIRVFRNDVTVRLLAPDTQSVIESAVLSPREKARVVHSAQPVLTLLPFEAGDSVESWVQENLRRDRDHLAYLRERELDTLRLAAGTLPGDMLYPIKQAKERLKLALTFDEMRTNTQIEIANQRLNEAIVLLGEGKRQEAMESLMMYQSLAREIAEKAKGEKINNLLTRRLVTPHQKALVASLPSNIPISLVKETLNQTEELLIDDPIEREKVRMENSIERLQDAALLVESGDIALAKEALTNHQLAVSDLLTQAAQLEDTEAQKALFETVLQLKDKETELIASIHTRLENRDSENSQLMALLEGAEEQAKDEMDRALAYIKPLMPDVVKAQKAQSLIDQRVQSFVARVGIYSTWQGQKNQIQRLLKEQVSNVRDLDFLKQVRDKLDGRARDFLNAEILELEARARYQKHKAMKRKIERARRLR